jgi:hypothetical protein
MTKTDWNVFRRFIRKGQTAYQIRNMMRKLILILALVFAAPLAGHGQTYSLPNDNTGCPSNCRQITWQTGSDIWNGGVLPNYTGVTCTGLADDGVTDDGPAIQACINALSPKQCAVIPAGVNYFIDSVVRLQSFTCLRGAQPEGAPPFLPTAQSGETRLILGPSADWNSADKTSVALLTNQVFSAFNAAGSAGGLFPPQHYGVYPTTNCFLSGSPQKGDTTVTIAGGNPAGCAISAGTWLEIYGPDDPNLISSTGTDGFCEWCGNNSGFYLQQQMVQVTNLVGSVATLSKPLYYTINPASQTVTGPGGSGTVTEPAGVQYSVITFATVEAGFENLRIDGSLNDIGAGDILLFRGCLFCWMKNVETFTTGLQDGSAHVEIDYGYGDEIRDSAFHDQRTGCCGAGYGIYFQFSNSDHKVENNILYHNRHWITYQGGGTGTAILYNYADDGYTDDLTYFAGGRTSHGGHPFFNLFEGNINQHLAADDFWGSSSHDVMFRNWFRGGEPNFDLGSGTIASFPPNSGFDAVDLYTGQPYYSYVANILGNNSDFPTLDEWSAATLSGFNEYASPTAPIVYSYGGTNTLGGANVASSAATIIRQGNWDYLTNGVAFNDGGNCGGSCIYNPSMYYGSEPVFISSAGCAWPEQGPDLSVHGSLRQPAYMRAIGGTCTPPPPVPAFTIGGTAVTVGAGATSGNTSTITITPSGGFTGSVQLIAAITNSPSGAVELPTLSFTANPVINSGTTTLTITTTAPVAATSTTTSSDLVNPKGPSPWYAAGGATLACLLLFGIPARRRSWRTMLGMLVLLVALAGGGVLGCGGTTYNIAQTQSTPGTTAGTYTITVIGTSGTITESGTVTLTVQ